MCPPKVQAFEYPLAGKISHEFWGLDPGLNNTGIFVLGYSEKKHQIAPILTRTYYSNQAGTESKEDKSFIHRTARFCDWFYRFFWPHSTMMTKKIFCVEDFTFQFKARKAGYNSAKFVGVILGMLHCLERPNGPLFPPVLLPTAGQHKRFGSDAQGLEFTIRNQGLIAPTTDHEKDALSLAWFAFRQFQEGEIPNVL